MTQRNSGLRFDIYERVHLGEDVVSIRGLVEVELVPHIQIMAHDEQAVLKGILLLTGTYDGIEEAGHQHLEHRIPVEITLPLYRIHRLEDIEVEIENFDIDLLSARSINVTGVLSLQGIELSGQADESTWDEEEVTFVHQIQSDAAFREQESRDEGQEDQMMMDSLNDDEHMRSDVEHPGLSEQLDEEGIRLAKYEEPSAFFAFNPERSEKQHNTWSGWPGSAAKQEASVQEEHTELTEQPVHLDIEEHTQPVMAPAHEEILPIFENIAPETNELEEVLNDKRLSADEKSEVKIAFGTKKEEDAAGSAHTLKLFADKQESQGSSAKTAGNSSERKEQEIGREIHSSDEVEWKSLLSGLQSEENTFRKLRICIVQKEETLDKIAKRYSLSSREIAQHNRLTDSQISEGQIIYIPVSK